MPQQKSRSRVQPCRRCAELEQRVSELDRELQGLREAAASPPPLRHQLVDLLNDAVHRIPGAHGTLKRATLWIRRGGRSREEEAPPDGAPAPVPSQLPGSPAESAPDPGGVVPAASSEEPPTPGDPASLQGIRGEIAERYLDGEGFEIGALQNPLPLPPNAQVRYVDRLTLEQARVEYRELDGWPLVHPQIIAEADRLDPIATASVDFLIANHVLEHVRNPVAALREWLRVLKPGGHLYVSVPDHENPFDRTRAVTPFEHLLEDESASTGLARAQEDREHYRDWTRALHPDAAPEARESLAADLEARRYAIHFHVFDRTLFERLLDHACAGAGAVLELRTNVEEPEHIAIVQRGA